MTESEVYNMSTLILLSTVSPKKGSDTFMWYMFVNALQKD